MAGLPAEFHQSSDSGNRQERHLVQQRFKRLLDRWFGEGLSFVINHHLIEPLAAKPPALAADVNRERGTSQPVYSAEGFAGGYDRDFVLNRFTAEKNCDIKT